MITKRSTSRWLGVTALGAALVTVAPAPAGATSSGENGRILFQVETSDGAQLYSVKANGKDLRQITHVSGDAARGDWAPDGSRITFELGSPDTANIAFVRPDGTQLTVLPTVGGGIDADPSFTPDGQHVVFERFDPETGDDAIWVMRTDGTARRRIATGPYGAGDPNVSPDGRTLTFVGGGGSDGLQALFRVDMDGSHLAQLTSFAEDVAIKHDWSPDGSHLLLANNADVDAAANVLTMRPDGSGVTQLTHYTTRPDSAYAGSYSPDGQWIVYRYEHNGQYALRRMRPDGTDVHTLLPLSAFRPRLIDWGSRSADDGTDG